MAGNEEHYACGGGGEQCHEYQWHAAYRTLVDTVAEEATAVRALVDDDDSSCPARELRRQRLAALEWVMALGDTLERWEW